MGLEPNWYFAAHYLSHCVYNMQKFLWNLW